ncbi:alpha/beta hydrolase [Hymenobacter sp. 5516J-16]|uniref:alpha/beta hydrolase n=1 Tax=Hymenobacter sp. 5516J-16 TaxID=2932253 RepID=UPI001FD2B891|nr:alpha/beta hydrolase [Hymenobacter sp. 5516J-16]UOQ79180.1 alpha/beta hydrolase [Hymenobacter sp. 5516J-16]
MQRRQQRGARARPDSARRQPQRALQREHGRADARCHRAVRSVWHAALAHPLASAGPHGALGYGCGRNPAAQKQPRSPRRRRNDHPAPDSGRLHAPVGPDGILVRIYTPTSGSGPFPVVVYYHGGGWVIGSLDVYEPSAKALAEKAGAIVVNVDYRLSPEAKFPAAHEDAYAAYKWARDNAASFGGNPAKVAVAGESAGGNMAVGVSLLAKERSLTLPTHILSVYPVANNDLNTASYNQYANAQPLNRPNVQYFTMNYFRTMADGDNRLISLVDVADLRGLPATTIIAAEIDPLLTEGQQLRDKLTQVGVATQYMLYSGTTHEFFGTHDVVPKAIEAQDFAASRLKAAFQ